MDGHDNNWGFSDEDMAAIKKFVEIAIKQGSPIDDIFPGEGRLQEAAAYLYLTMKNFKFTWGVKPQPPDTNDQIIDHAALPAAPTELDMRKYFSPIENQLDLNSCSANAFVGAIEMLEKKSSKYMDESRLYLWYNTRLIEGIADKDEGVYIRDVPKALTRYGICKESTWPYDKKKWKNTPNDTAYSEGRSRKDFKYYAASRGDVGALKKILAQGYPVVFGMWCFPAFMDTAIMKTGILPEPKSGEKAEGGHAILAAGYSDSKSWIICRNSYGTLWGDSGWFYMPYSYYEKWTFDPWVLTKV